MEFANVESYLKYWGPEFINIMPQPEPAPASKVPEKKMHLWLLTVVTYSLVIILTVFAWWAYHYLDEKAHREQHPGKPLDPIRGTRK
jgi:hypothetical protein